MGYQDYASAIKNRASDAASDLSDGVSRAAERLDRDGGALARDAANRANAFSKQAAKSFRDVQADARELSSTVGDAAGKFSGDFSSLIRERPLTVVLSAAAVGLAIGLMTRR